jgi:phosphohistidine phosphatase
MEVYLIRHVHALKLEEAGVADDEDRPLSEEGEAVARQLARGLQSRGVQLEAILTTPLARALRTAEILVEEWSGQPPEVIVEKGLAPECKPRKLGRILRDVHKDRVAVVGHQPDLGLWAAWLIGSKKAEIDFAKGGVACIDWDDKLKKGTGALVWLVTPDWFSPPASEPNTKGHSVVA